MKQLFPVYCVAVPNQLQVSTHSDPLPIPETCEQAEPQKRIKNN